MKPLDECLKHFQTASECSLRASELVKEGSYLPALIAIEYAIKKLNQSRDFLIQLPVT